VKNGGKNFFQKKKTLKKCDNLGTFTQKVLFLDYNKTRKEKQLLIRNYKSAHFDTVFLGNLFSN